MDIHTVDDYIACFPSEVQEILNQIRATIRKAAPQAKEIINYKIPTYSLNGNLVHFAAYKKHIGFYPSPSAIAKFKDKLENYHTAKGSIQFPLNKEIPYQLISDIVKFRVAECTK